MKYFLSIVTLLSVLVAPAHAGTIYVDTAGANGALATNSGSTDTTTPTASGTAATAAGTTVTLDVSTDLGATSTTPGPTQGAINIAGATNTNRTIFWITGITSGCTGTAVACVITVDVAPTGVTTNSWSVGGRYLWPGTTVVNVVEGAICNSTAQDIVQFNTTPTSRTTANYFTMRASGTSSSGQCIIRGKSGVSPKPKLQTTGNVNVINFNNTNNWRVDNLELANGGALDVIVNTGGTGEWLSNVWVSAGGGAGVQPSSNMRITNSEFSGLTGDAIVFSGGSGSVVGSYIHGNTGNGITLSNAAPNQVILDSLIVGNTGRGIFQSSSSVTAQSHNIIIAGNTIANNTGVQLETTDIDIVVSFRNNIFANTSATNIVKWGAGTAELFGNHAYNVFYSSGGGALSGVTANSSELTSDPLFVNTGTGDWGLQATSPALGVGFPGVIGNSTTTGYRDIGAFQRQMATGGSTGQLRPGIGQ